MFTDPVPGQTDTYRLPSLRASVEAANTHQGDDTIRFDPGVALSVIELSNGELVLADTTGTTAIAGLGTDQLTVSGKNSSRVFNIAGSVTVSISGLTMVQGNAASANGGGICNAGTLTLTDSQLSLSSGYYGGGIFNSGTLTLANDQLAQNSGYFGGGVYNSGTLTITDTTLSQNSVRLSGSGSDSSSGGAIYSAGTTTITGSAFSQNAAGAYGGAVYRASGTLTVTGSTLSGNSAGFGSGGAIYNASASGTLTVSGSTLSGNGARFGGGGVYNSGTLTIADSILSANWAYDDSGGGGIYNSGTLTLTNSTLSGNSAPTMLWGQGAGGGLYNSGTGSATVSGSTFSQNSANSNSSYTNRGGGVYNFGTLTITSSTFSGNSAGIGGGIYNAGTLTLGNTIAAGNTASSYSPDIWGSIVANYCLFQSTYGITFINVPSGNVVGSPFLGTLGNYGGPTQTMPPLPGSPAVDAGRNSLVPPSATTDQRGLPRIVGGTVDIGAVESSGFTLSVLSGDAQTTRVDTTFGLPLRVVVSGSNGEPVNGGIVTFTAQPVNGASAVFPSGSTGTVQNGLASVTARANAVPGTYTVTAAAGSAAGSVSFTLSNKLAQSISFDPLADQTYGVPPITLQATATSGLPVAFTVVSGPATVSGNTLTITGAGRVTVEAAQTGDGTYLAAPPIDRSFTVNKASLTITADDKSTVYGATLPAFTVSYQTFVYQDDPSVLGGTLTFAITPSPPIASGNYTITPGGLMSDNYSVTFVPGTLAIQQAATTTSASASPGPVDYGQPLTIRATVGVDAPGSGIPTGSVDFFDTTTGTDLGAVNLSGATASLSTASLPIGVHSIKATYGGDSNFLVSTGMVSVVIEPAVYLLNPKASGSLTVSGTTQLTLPGRLEIDSRARNALSASGSANLKARQVLVAGGVRIKGKASVAPNPTIGATTTPDPLAALPAPTTGTAQKAVNLTKGSRTIDPGVYSAIRVGGNASLTLNPGVYVLAGGGFKASGSARVSGSGVVLYNAGNKFPLPRGKFAGITIGKKANVTITPPTSGPYAGIAVFQSRDNTKLLSISGGASLTATHGVIYAPAAAVKMTGGAPRLDAALVVGRLTMGGSASLLPTAAAAAGESAVLDGAIPRRPQFGNSPPDMGFSAESISAALAASVSPAKKKDSLSAATDRLLAQWSVG